jgi:hypothetical protein
MAGAQGTHPISCNHLCLLSEDARCQRRPAPQNRPGSSPAHWEPGQSLVNERIAVGGERLVTSDRTGRSSPTTWDLARTVAYDFPYLLPARHVHERIAAADGQGRHVVEHDAPVTGCQACQLVAERVAERSQHLPGRYLLLERDCGAP